MIKVHTQTLTPTSMEADYSSFSMYFEENHLNFLSISSIPKKKLFLCIYTEQEKISTGSLSIRVVEKNPPKKKKPMGRRALDGRKMLERCPLSNAQLVQTHGRILYP